MKSLNTDLCVIGAGSGGLSVAAGAARMGARVVLVERAKMGGDCLNYGCVPSKALIAAGHAAHVVRTSAKFGVNGHEPAIDFTKVHDHVHGVIATIAPHDSVERFTALGVDVVQAPARLIDAHTVEAGDRRITARRFVIATGSSPAIPDIAGLAEVPYLTNETVFDLRERPEHLVVIGGGPIGSELAQAHRRLGARVTMVVRGRLLPRDEPEAAAVVAKRLGDEGIDVREHTTPSAIVRQGNGIGVQLLGAPEGTIAGSHLLVAVGRRPNIGALQLEKAGIRVNDRGIMVDARLRTSNRRVFAIGDVLGGPQFTHVASYHAGIVIRSALFALPARVDHRAVPWVTYTDPELARVGPTESEARLLDSRIRALTWSFSENDRAQTERDTEGFAKVLVGAKGRIVGATIVGPRAGELILPWVLAIKRRMRIGALADVIVPYPTLSEVSKRAAGSYYSDALFSARTRRIVRLLQRLP